MDMSKVEGMNMVEEQDHLTNHRLREEDMNMVEEHYHPMNHRPKVEDMDMVGIHMVEVGVSIQWSSITTPEVEGMDREDSGMREDMTVCEGG
jgi:hypothetical protein